MVEHTIFHKYNINTLPREIFKIKKIFKHIFGGPEIFKTDIVYLYYMKKYGCIPY